MSKYFVDWINIELQKRGWSDSELGRRAELGPSTISMVLNGQNKPGLHFCLGVARAFREPPEYILRLAGLLPPLPNDDKLAQLVTEVVKQLPLQDQELILWFARARLREYE